MTTLTAADLIDLERQALAKAQRALLVERNGIVQGWRTGGVDRIRQIDRRIEAIIQRQEKLFDVGEEFEA